MELDLRGSSLNTPHRICETFIENGLMVMRRLQIQKLESRQLLACDGGGFDDQLFELPTVDPLANRSPLSINHLAVGSNLAADNGESESTDLEDDLVAFATALTGAEVKLYGAAWDSDTNDQLAQFEDGASYLDFIESTDESRNLNLFGLQNDIQVFPTWIRADGERLEGIKTLAEISTFAELEIPKGNTPSFRPIGQQTVLIRSPLHIAIDAYDPNGGPLTTTVTVDNPDLLSAEVIEGNRSLRLAMQDYSDMVFELFEQRAPIASGRVIDLALAEFYDGLLFHRVAKDFVIQTGDPDGTGRSSLDDFDDEFHPDLQHNREGVLSFAKGGDDTNNSQFFITDRATRTLDFNHSILGQLVEGELTRDAINSQAIDSAERPVFDTIINSAEVFQDNENSIIMLKSVADTTGTANVTVTVTDQDGNMSSETFEVTVALDPANSQPYLGPISAPAPGPINRQLTLQLTSIDIEDDPVSYFTQVLSPLGAAQATVDQNGLLTVTPTDDFSGEVEVGVGVRRATGVQGSESDIQRLTFVFDPTITAPPLFDLLPGSDSGASQSDNITAESSMEFIVIDTAVDDRIELLVDGNVIFTETATGDQTLITTDAVSNLGEGTHRVTIQTTRGEEVLTGNTIEIGFDSTLPRIDPTTVPAQAIAGQSIESTLQAIGEASSGLLFELSSGPEDLRVDSDTAELSWTPVADQIGIHAIRLRVTDVAGNTSLETFTITVVPDPNGPDPLVAIEIQATDLDGNPITTVEASAEFLLVMTATDLRPALSFSGVYAAFADIAIDSDILSVQPLGSITYGSDFTAAQDGLVTSDAIEELGAVNENTEFSNIETSVIASVRVRANSAGTALIQTNPAEDTGHDVLLYGIDEVIGSERVQFGQLAVEVVASWHRADDPTNVNGDEATSFSDALAVINVIGQQQGSFAVSSIDLSDFNPEFRYDVTGEGLVTPRDALVVINTIARRAAPGSESEPSLLSSPLVLSDFLNSFKKAETEGLERGFILD